MLFRSIYNRWSLQLVSGQLQAQYETRLPGRYLAAHYTLRYQGTLTAHQPYHWQVVLIWQRKRKATQQHMSKRKLTSQRWRFSVVQALSQLCGETMDSLYQWGKEQWSHTEPLFWSQWCHDLNYVTVQTSIPSLYDILPLDWIVPFSISAPKETDMVSYIREW